MRATARRWAGAVIGVDLAGLPVFLFLTSWAWPMAVAAWVVGMAALVMVAVAWHERARTRRAEEFVRRQLRLREIAGLPPAQAVQPVPAAPRRATHAGLAF
jgi:hypothetical protein